MQIVDALVVTLGFDLSAFKRGKSEAGSATKKLTAEERAAAKEIEERNKKAAESFRSIRNEVLALVAIFTAGVGIKQFTESTINSAVNLGYMAQNLQMSTRDLSAWQRAAERAGGSAEGITAALQSSQNDISKLKFGQVTEGVQWFLRMGGSVKDLKDGNSYLLARSRIISNMFKADPGRARFIAQQMGIGDGEFNFLKQGETAVLALVDAQKKNSAVTEKQAEQALKLKNEWLDLRDRLQYVGTTVLLELMPTFEKLLGKLQNMADWVANHKADISAWIDRAVASVQQFVEWADKAAAAVGGWKNVLIAFAGLKLLSMASGVLSLAGALFKLGGALGGVSTAGASALPILGRLLGIAGLALYSQGLNEGEDKTRLTQPGDTWDGDPVGKARAAANSGSLAERRRYLIGRLKEAGYTDAQAAGIAGSLQQESQLDPTAVNKTSGAAGIAQWLGPRAREFEKQFGHPIAQSTFGEQVDFMLWELKNTEKQADQRLRMAKTPEFAAEVHSREYERPGAAEANIARRQQYAREVFAGLGQANAAQIAQQTAAAAAPAGGNSTSTTTNTNEMHVNGPITVHTQATDAPGTVRGSLNSRRTRKMVDNAFGYRGSQRPTSGTSPFNEQSFLVWQILRTIAGARLVEVKAVTNAGSVSPVGFVDVLPLVNQLDGSDNAMPHGVIHNLPYFRLQGGANAVIIDPQVGDIGVAIVEDRDISSVKVNRGAANPGSKRIFDMADGLYLGGFLNGAPSQYVRFSAAGVEIVSPTQIRMAAPSIVLQADNAIGLTAGSQITNSAPAVEIDGQMTQGEGPLGGTASMQGPLTVVNDVTAQGTSVHTHTHGGVQTGGGNTGAPN